MRVLEQIFIKFQDSVYYLLIRKNETRIILKTGRFGNIDSAVIISSVSKAEQNRVSITTAESMLSKRPVFRITVFILLP